MFPNRNEKKKRINFYYRMAIKRKNTVRYSKFSI